MTFWRVGRRGRISRRRKGEEGEAGMKEEREEGERRKTHCIHMEGIWSPGGQGTYGWTLTAYCGIWDGKLSRLLAKRMICPDTTRCV